MKIVYVCEKCGASGEHGRLLYEHEQRCKGEGRVEGLAFWRAAQQPERLQ